MLPTSPVTWGCNSGISTCKVTVMSKLVHIQHVKNTEKCLVRIKYYIHVSFYTCGYVLGFVDFPGSLPNTGNVKD